MLLCRSFWSRRMIFYEVCGSERGMVWSVKGWLPSCHSLWIGSGHLSVVAGTNIFQSTHTHIQLSLKSRLGNSLEKIGLKPFQHPNRFHWSWSQKTKIQSSSSSPFQHWGSFLIPCPPLVPCFCIASLSRPAIEAFYIRPRLRHDFLFGPPLLNAD